MLKNVPVHNDFPCVHREYCGGCTYNGLEYSEAIIEKENEVRSLMREKAGLILLDENIKKIPIDIKPGEAIFNGRYEGIQGAQKDWRFQYRNKMEYTFGDLTKDGELELGMHKKGNYMSIVTVDKCQLVPEDFNLILDYTLNFAKASGLKHYHKKTHNGVFRNLIIRRGVRTGEILVDLVTSSEADGINGTEHSFDAKGWKDGLINLKLNDNNKIVGIMHTINDNIADAVNCDEQRILYGRDYYYEEICNLRFKVNVFSFFQTNVDAVERLYLEAIDLLSDLEGKVVYDLFCGTGTISQIVAKRAKHVIGIEIVEDSVESARANTGLNGINNCDFICGDVYEVLNSVTSMDSNYSGIPNPDIIIVDPPRVGLRTKAINKITSYGVPEILYISCNPKTLAMDLADLKTCGYELDYLKAYDNFCWTKHVECVAKLVRK